MAASPDSPDTVLRKLLDSPASTRAPTEDGDAKSPGLPGMPVDTPERVRRADPVYRPPWCFETPPRNPSQRNLQRSPVFWTPESMLPQLPRASAAPSDHQAPVQQPGLVTSAASSQESQAVTAAAAAAADASDMDAEFTPAPGESDHDEAETPPHMDAEFTPAPGDESDHDEAETPPRPSPKRQRRQVLADNDDEFLRSKKARTQ